MTNAKVTTDREVIRTWVEARGGQPARLKHPEDSGKQPIIAIDYTGFEDDGTLEFLAWASWFDAFDNANLAFTYEERGRSRGAALVPRPKVATPHRAVAAARTSAMRTTSKPRVAATAARSVGVTSDRSQTTATSRKAPRAAAARMGKPTPRAALTPNSGAKRSAKPTKATPKSAKARQPTTARKTAKTERPATAPTAQKKTLPTSARATSTRAAKAMTKKRDRVVAD